MRKVTFLIALVSLIGFQRALAQIGASVVTAPNLEGLTVTNNSILSTMSGTLALLEEAEQKIEDIKTSTAWINQLQSVGEIILLVDQISCNAKDLNINLIDVDDIVGSRASCWNNSTYLTTITHLSAFVDVLNNTLSVGRSMEQSDRLLIFNTLVKDYKHIQRELREMNQELILIKNRFEHEQDHRSSFRNIVLGYKNPNHNK